MRIDGKVDLGTTIAYVCKGLKSVSARNAVVRSEVDEFLRRTPNKERWIKGNAMKGGK